MESVWGECGQEWGRCEEVCWGVECVKKSRGGVLGCGKRVRRGGGKCVRGRWGWETVGDVWEVCWDVGRSKKRCGGGGSVGKCEGSVWGR